MTPAVQVARLQSIGLALQPDIAVLLVTLDWFLSDTIKDDSLTPGYKRNADGRYELSYAFRNGRGYKFRTSQGGAFVYWLLDHSMVARVINARRNAGWLAEWPKPAEQPPELTSGPQDECQSAAHGARARTLGRWSARRSGRHSRRCDPRSVRDQPQQQAAGRARHAQHRARLRTICGYARKALTDAIQSDSPPAGLGFADFDGLLLEKNGSASVEKLHGFGKNLGTGHLNIEGNRSMARSSPRSSPRGPNGGVEVINAAGGLGYFFACRTAINMVLGVGRRKPRPPGGSMGSVTKIMLADLAHTHSVSDRSLPIPLSIGYIKAYAVDALGDSVDIRLFKHPERFLAAIDARAPGHRRFCELWLEPRISICAIGRHVRRLLPDALIVAGGPNIDTADDRRLAFLKQHDYIDYLIVDGGEEPFTELVLWHREGSRDIAELPSNIVWRDGDRVHQTPERPLKKIIEHLPSPYLMGYLDEFLAAGMIPLFETNRGCPFRCTFCAWGSASKDLVRRIDLDQSLAEIAYVGERSDAANWIICDANFGILPRDIEIAKAIRKVKDERGYPNKCHVWLAKNVTDRNLVIGEILSEMVQPVMAIQSLDNEVLKHIKRDNISTDTYAQYQKKFHRIGSRTYSDLIVPLPAETIETHLRGLRTLLELGVDIVQNHNMRLLAGAETNSQETREQFKFRTRYRLIHGDAGIYRTPGGVADQGVRIRGKPAFNRHDVGRGFVLSAQAAFPCRFLLEHRSLQAAAQPGPALRRQPDRRLHAIARRYRER